MSAVVDEEVGMPVSEIEEAGEWSLSLKDSHESALVPLSDVHKVHNEDDDELKIDTSNSGYQPVEAVAKLEVTIEDDSAKNIKTWQEHVHTWVISYAKKFAGVEGKKAPPMTKRHEMVYSSILAFIGIFLVSLTDYWYLTPEHDVDGLGIKMLTGAYAATSGRHIHNSLNIVIYYSCRLLYRLCMYCVLYSADL
ncbi:hypothetical protein EON65_50795 [archaeon]|nr:MAG: hypothetical protein EON65_50795 [archaeon]